MRASRSVVLAVMLVFAVAQPARGQTVAPDTADVGDLWRAIRHRPAEPPGAWDYRDPMKALAPVIGAKPSAGVLLGVAGNVAFFRGDPATTRISSIVASLTFSTKKQTSLSGRFTVFSAEDRWRLEGDNRAQWTSQDTYGLGTTSSSADVENVRFDFARIHETAYRRLRSHLSGGLGLHYDDHRDIRAGPGAEDDWATSAFVTYSNANNLPLDRQISAGLSANLLFDSRDSAIDPRRGSFASGSYRALIRGFLGGSSTWQLFHLDARTYVPLTPDSRHRLAFWTFGDVAFGGPAPYFDLPATGMDAYGRSGRGYAEGRFRGERLLYGEVEYRGPLMSNNLVSMVAFLNTTTVSNLPEGERLFQSVAPAAGAGLRLLINKRSRTNLGLDVGFGKGSHGVYLSVQEAF